MDSENYSEERTCHLKIGSLNCRTIYKISDRSSTSEFLRYLRSLKYSLLLFQETAIPSHSFDSTTHNLNLQLQVHQAVWTAHCGIVNLHPALDMKVLKQAFDGRLILASVTMPDMPSFHPIYILNLYAPVSTDAIRNEFFQNMVSALYGLEFEFPDLLNYLFIGGNFNYCFDQNSNHHTRRGAQPHGLLQLFGSRLVDCLNDPASSEPYYPTFKSTQAVHTCTDYMFASPLIRRNTIDGAVLYLNRRWTDHALLSIQYSVGLSLLGKGLWRANPNLVRIFSYIHKINPGIESYATRHLAATTFSPQQHWDRLKKLVAKLTRNFCRFRSHWRDDRIRVLQSERNSCYRNYAGSELLDLFVEPIEKELALLQKELSEIALLKSGKRWLANNEKSAGYLKRTATARQRRRHILHLVHPDTGVMCTDPQSKLNAAADFYQNLYSTEPTDNSCIDDLLAHIDKTMDAQQAESLVEPLTFDDIIQGARRSPKQSSPGRDGLPYEILCLIIDHPACKNLVVTVFNDAIRHQRFPASWLETCIVLLPKSGDLSNLVNWRPISLINADCKIFTRLLNQRVMMVADDLISPFQAGFMHGRYIGDHGQTLRLIMNDAKLSNSSGLGIMLDQHKAYDRIHPEYLTKVLRKFGFPDAFVDTIGQLFFATQIIVNVNGFLSRSMVQNRGLRQGDAISPILFNLALEPFLLSVLHNEAITGYVSQSNSIPCSIPIVPPPPVKLLAYADDVIIFINSVDEFTEVQSMLTNYNAASNSLVNYNKSVAFPLQGSLPSTSRIRNLVINETGLRWFDSHSPNYLRYLGYPIWVSTDQRQIFCQELLAKIKASFDIHRQRQISIYGRAHIANVLILSKLWHVLRTTTLPARILDQIESMSYQFVTHGFFPKIAKRVLYLPKS